MPAPGSAELAPPALREPIGLAAAAVLAVVVGHRCVRKPHGTAQLCLTLLSLRVDGVGDATVEPVECITIMSTVSSSVSDMLMTVKSREVQRGMLAEMQGDRSSAARHFLAAAHMELVLAADFDACGDTELAMRSRLSAASCFWRAGRLPDRSRTDPGHARHLSGSSHDDPGTSGGPRAKHIPVTEGRRGNRPDQCSRPNPRCLTLTPPP